MEKKYSYDAEIQNNILSRLNDQNNMNQINLDQRQRIFEDIIISRIKVIQNYVKKQLKVLKN